MVNITIRNGIHRYHTCYLLHLHPTPTDYRIWHLACLKWGVQAHAHRLITQNYQVPAANITLVSIFHPPSLFGVMREMLPNQASHKDFFFWVFYPKTEKPSIYKSRGTEVMEKVTQDILQRVWQELDYRLDVCCATGCAHIELLWSFAKSTSLWRICLNFDK